jgi:hypothetical protein
MISYFKDGIMNIIPQNSIHLNQLVVKVKNNPQKSLIENIRKLRKEGFDEEVYKKKRLLDYITPACVLRKRLLKKENYNNNFVMFSGYIYIDIDLNDLSLVETYKNNIINRHKSIISFCCLSASMRGITILIHVDADIITAEDYKVIWNYIVAEYFSEEPVDESTCDISRANYLSYDPNVYVNYDVCLDLKNVQLSRYCSKEDNILNKSERITGKNNKQNNNINETLNDSLDNYLGINNSIEYPNDLIYKTPIVVHNPILDIESREFNEVRFDLKIPDGKKHNVFQAVIHTLVHLNSHISREKIFDVLEHLNRRQFNKMAIQRIYDLIDFNLSIIRKPNYIFRSNYRLLHFSQSCNLSKYQKQRISNLCTSIIKMNKSIDLIKHAKNEILKTGQIITKAKVIRISGLSRNTVYRHFDAEKIDLKWIEQQVNCGNISFPISKNTDFDSDL